MIDSFDIIDEWSAQLPLNREQRQWLASQGVPPSAIDCDGDGHGHPLAAARVTLSNYCFDFDDDGQPAIIAVARDCIGRASDLVAWQPKSGATAPWIGRAALLGEPIRRGFSDSPILVRSDFLDWLRSGRTGVVILDPTRARWRLTDIGPLCVSSISEGQRLRDALTVRAPEILVAAGRAA